MVTAAPRQQPGGFFCRMERAQCRAAAGNARHGFSAFFEKTLAKRDKLWYHTWA